MGRLEFNTSPKPTLGVEIELGLVDAETMALSSGNAPLLEIIGDQFGHAIKPELMQCYLEVNTGICQSVAQAEEDLRMKLAAVEAAADELGLRLLWSGTHPFSNWRSQVVTPNPRYEGLVDLMQDTARQLVTFGLHVHVGVDSGDKAVMICDRILSHLPVLLAASANSPFWEGRDTGLCSWRSKIMDGLPTAGLPPLMRNWSEYVWLINHMIDTGFIETIREIWWDVRPHHNFGTVEVRICDVPGSLDDAMALAALIQCLVTALGDQIEHGTYQHDCHPMLVRQNKWRAARFGLDAPLVSSTDYQLRPARQVLRDLVRTLEPTAGRLDCVRYLKHVHAISERDTHAQRQRKMYEQTGKLGEMLRAITEGTRMKKARPAEAGRAG
ncbi:MAG: YbdK family carboxylate-amine ligase [Planctomycetes bacterium]|nr:YbdK family carboxylate-amine ligase [Planctomycetota bacterium]